MLYRDVERLLETDITISIEQQHPLFPLLLREAETVPLDSYRDGNDYYVDLFICDKAALKLTGVLSAYSPARIGDCDIVRVKAEEMEAASVIMDGIGNIDFAVRGGLYLNSGKIYIDYRVSSSSKNDLTAVANRIRRMNNRIRIADLGPGAGGINILNNVDSRIHLGVVSYEADILPEIGISGDRDFFLEYNFTKIDETGFRAVMYDGSSISVQHIRSRFLREVQRLSVEKKIPKAAIFAKPVDGKYRSFTLLPFSMIDTQLSMLFEAHERFPDTEFNILAVRSYDSRVWGWI
ncbi:MAG: hypothetical protein ACP5NK_06995 [Thermoplasmata archaeon]